MDQLSKVAASLPMANYLVFDSVVPLREYESFGQDIDNRSAALGEIIATRPENPLPTVAGGRPRSERRRRA